MTPDIVPFTSALKAEMLSSDQVEALQAGTLTLLEEVGVLFPSTKALQIFADSGAQVDWESQIVRIPSDLVRRAMSSAPRSFTLAGREPRFDLVLDGQRSYLATDGCGVSVIDPFTREHRASRKDDVAMMARVCDALPMISFFWPLVSAQDHGRSAPLHECHAGLTNTLKHVRGGTTMDPQLAPYLVEMATVVAGSEEERRRRPPVCANICTIAPLAQDESGIETALVYAGAGIPTSFMAMPTMGSTAPATPLGSLIVGDAEVVSAMVLMQLAYPGAPVFHSVFISLMHPRTGGYIGHVPLPLSMMTVQLAHAWNVPSLGGGSVGSDAQEIGWQSGSEAGLGAAHIPLCGGEISGYMGMLGGSMILAPEQVILDHEVCLNAFGMMKQFDFDAGDMALDVIRKVGPRGHFLRQKHTRQHIRDFRLPPWQWYSADDGDTADAPARALEEFKRIEATHHPEPLPRVKMKELDRVLSAAELQAAQIV